MRTRLTALYLCFFLSGMAALIYEIVWQRMLTLVFGVSTWSIAAVLTAYMAGLALGAWAFGRLADRLRRVVRVYGGVELLIAASGLLVSGAIEPLMSVYVRLAGSATDGFFLSHAIRFVLALAVFIIPSTLIGATIPLMSRIVTRQTASLGVGFGRFYAVNTFGAVLGAALAGFVLIRYVGMHHAVYVAAGGNVLAALVALVFGGPLETVRQDAPTPTVGAPDASAAPDRSRQLWILAGVAGLTGLGYEVAWSRLLAVYTLNSVYIFTMLLTVFLAGLAIGSAIAARLLRKHPQATATLAAGAQLLLAMTAPLVLALTREASFVGLEMQYRSAEAVFLLEYGLVLAVVFVPSVLLGVTLPLLAGLLPRGEATPGRSVGTLYAFNSVGAIIGAAATGILLIPTIGLRATLMLYGAMNFAAGCWIATTWRAETVRRVPLIPVAAVAMVVLSLLLTPAAHFIRPPASDVDAVVYYVEGENAVVHVGYIEIGTEIQRAIYLDSQSVAGDSPELITDQKMLAHLPLLLHPAPQRALTVGFGTGGTSFSMLLHEVETHCVEIERAVPAAAKYFFKQNHGVVGLAQGLDPTRRDFQLILDDARSWLHLAPQPYDVIVDDLTSIQYRGNGNLYTRECFALIRDKLTPDGVGCAWVPITGIDASALKMLVRTFQKAFPHTSIWYMNNRVNDFVILVGTPERLTIDLADWEVRMAERYVAADLAAVGLDDPFRLAACLLLDEDEVSCYCGTGPVHTDNQPLLDYLTHAGVYQDTLAGNLREMLACQRTTGGDVPVSYAGETSRELAAQWDTWRHAMVYLLEGHALTRDGDRAGARAAYRSAAAIVPGDALLARLAGQKATTAPAP